MEHILHFADYDLVFFEKAQNRTELSITSSLARLMSNALQLLV